MHTRIVTKKLATAGVVAGLALASPARATQLTFEDVSVGQNEFQYVNDLYGGLYWNNLQLNALGYYGGGFDNGVVSGSWDIYDGFAQGGSITAPGTFKLNSAYFTGTGAGNVTVLGYDSSWSQIDSVTFAVTDSSPVLYTFNWTGLHSVTFANSGGYTVIDNMTINESDSGAVPEASVWTMMLAGFAALGVVAYRRKTAGVAQAA